MEMFTTSTNLPPNMSMPSYQFTAVWNSALSRPGDGIHVNDSQKAERLDQPCLEWRTHQTVTETACSLFYWTASFRSLEKQTIHDLCWGNTGIKVVKRLKKMVTTVGSKA